MFSLISEPEREIEINGKIYSVDDSFDNILRMFEITENNKNILGITLSIYTLLGEVPDLPPEQLIRLYQKIIEIYVNDGEKAKIERDLAGNIIPVKHKEWFSFRYDAWAIYSGFMQAYHIDLRNEVGKMRWNRFKALLNGLPSETRFKQILEIRQRPYPEGKGTAKERRALREAKESVSYPGADFT